MTTFKDRLIRAMEMRQMSAAELSRFSKVNEGAISQYRKGKYKASQPTIERLAKCLNVSIPWLMGAVDTFAPFESVSAGDVTEAERELIAGFRRLNEEGKQKVLEYTRDLAGLPQYILKNVSSAS